MSNLFGDYDGTSGGTQKTTYFKIKEGSNLFRILPPFGALRSSKKWSQYYGIFFLAGTSGKKKVVPTIFNKGRDGQITQHCPLYNKVQSLRAELETLKTSGNVSEAVLEAKTAQLWELSLDKGHYVNAMDASGNIGVLKIKLSAFKILKERLEELREEGVNPIGVGPKNGIYFDFKRYKDESGKTTYGVDIATTSTRDADGGIIKKYKTGILDGADIERVAKECKDLSTLYKAKTVKEMEMLATLDPKAVDRVFAKPEQTTDLNINDYDDGENEFSSDPEFNVPVTTPTAAFTQNTEVNGNKHTSLGNTSGRGTKQVPASEDDVVSQFLRKKN